MLVRLVMLVSVLSACTGANSTGIDPITCPTDSTLTYVNFGDQVIADNCATSGCHDRRKPMLTTQAAIQANASAILDEAVYTDAMPQNHDMPLAQREQLGEWLSCGAP